MGRRFTFFAGDEGPWEITSIRAVRGAPLADAPRLDLVPERPERAARWALPGITSDLRYTRRAELDLLEAVQAPIGRPEATHGALIPIRKSAAWWALTPDERRGVLEGRSHHIAIGMKYLPSIARRLLHCRDLGEESDFDFLTWFDFAPADAPRFDALLAELRATPEWGFVEREVEVRVHRAPRP